MNNNNFQLKIGLEIHLALKTKYKAFSATKTGANSYTSLGLIGTLPQINTFAIRSAYKMAWATHSDIPKKLTFERKSYFYFDLPRGYQITQHLNPIGKNGHIFLPNLKKKVVIRSVSLEEDTAAHSMPENLGGNYQLTCQRLGVPLIEIVTEPELTSAEEAIECVKLIRFLSFILKLSKAELESGQLRVDLNVSLVDENGEAKTGRAEIKNLASYKAIEQSTVFIKKHFLEKMTQKDVDIFANETFNWTEKTSSLTLLRDKMTEADYLFIPESCIPEITLPLDIREKLISETDQDRLNKIFKEIQNSKLADRERQEIIASYDFFWECCRIQEILKNWANAYFVLKIFHSVGGKKETFNNLIAFLHGLVANLFKEIDIKAFKFNNWKVRECCKRLNRFLTSVDPVVEYYISLPTIEKDEIVQLCEETIDSKREELMKLTEREEKISSFLLGVIREKFQEKVEMSEAKLIVDMKLKNFINRIINGPPEPEPEPEEPEPTTKLGQWRKKRREKKKEEEEIAEGEKEKEVLEEEAEQDAQVQEMTEDEGIKEVLEEFGQEPQEIFEEEEIESF
ncbi:glutamyl-tRNA amidotransferase [Mycoplasma wenyonii]|uniref:Glutamyl-tRNA amidotransferase n=1 Tax=Mycoplasma wenyonii TaxID=65123 RepID=A0A328PL39_9MOLU|nr:glutamyl-tRNA amidotransferase [Mycoplasma wenyonii]